MLTLKWQRCKQGWKTTIQGYTFIIEDGDPRIWSANSPTTYPNIREALEDYGVIQPTLPAKTEEVCVVLG